MHLLLNAVLAGSAIVLALIVVALTFVLAGLRRDARTIRDAQELRSVDLSRVISSHVPMAQRTNFPEQEIVLAEASVTRKRRSFGRALQLSALLLVVSIGANVGWHGWLKPGPAATGRRADATSPVPPPVVDPIAAVAGTWGWKFNALLSCKENPHTIKLSDDRHTLSIHFHTPLPTPSGNADGYDYDIVRIEPNELVLKLLAAPDRTDAMGRPLEWAIHFEDKNTYYLKRSDAVTQDTGAIIRCGGTS
jgi:hypothetical protein